MIDMKSKMIMSFVLFTTLSSSLTAFGETVTNQDSAVQDSTIEQIKSQKSEKLMVWLEDFGGSKCPIAKISKIESFDTVHSALFADRWDKNDAETCTTACWKAEGPAIKQTAFIFPFSKLARTGSNSSLNLRYYQPAGHYQYRTRLNFTKEFALSLETGKMQTQELKTYGVTTSGKEIETHCLLKVKILRLQE